MKKFNQFICFFIGIFFLATIFISMSPITAHSFFESLSSVVKPGFLAGIFIFLIIFLIVIFFWSNIIFENKKTDGIQKKEK